MPVDALAKQFLSGWLEWLHIHLEDICGLDGIALPKFTQSECPLCNPMLIVTASFLSSMLQSHTSTHASAYRLRSRHEPNMNDQSLLLMKTRLEVVYFKTIEPFLQKFDRFLTLRTFIRGYTLGTADEQIWTVLRLNKVALGLIRRAIFPNLTRWFSHIESTYPNLQPTAGDLATNTDATANQTRGRYNIKLQATENGVVTRFPPEPS